MYRAVTETFTSGTLATRSRATYRYGTDGIRFQATEETDTVLSLTTENWQLTTDTKYLIDAHNPTGYQQVLEETATDANGVVTSKIVYTIGLDHISQTKYAPSPGGEGWGEGVTHIFHMDGHGSTRVLTDLTGAILNVAGKLQAYHFDAYGNALNFTMSQAATQYLYSGEQFDSRIGQQYLRARYYDAATGTFNRLDPFFGNQNDPQSFHKYLYTHGDPVTGIDPNGEFFSAAGGLASMAISSGQRAWKSAADFATLNFIRFRLAVAAGTSQIKLVARAAWAAGTAWGTHQLYRGNQAFFIWAPKVEFALDVFDTATSMAEVLSKGLREIQIDLSTIPSDTERGKTAERMVGVNVGGTFQGLDHLAAVPGTDDVVAGQLKTHDVKTNAPEDLLRTIDKGAYDFWKKSHNGKYGSRELSGRDAGGSQLNIPLDTIKGHVHVVGIPWEDRVHLPHITAGLQATSDLLDMIIQVVPMPNWTKRNR